MEKLILKVPKKIEKASDISFFQKSGRKITKEVENELHRDVREAEQPAHETNLWTRGVSKCIIINKKNQQIANINY